MSNNEFLQTSWHYDKESNEDVAKVCFVFDNAVSISPYASAEEHEKAMGEAVDACSHLVSDVAASFGRQAHVASLRFMRFLLSCEALQQIADYIDPEGDDVFGGGASDGICNHGVVLRGMRCGVLPVKRRYRHSGCRHDHVSHDICDDRVGFDLFRSNLVW